MHCDSHRWENPIRRVLVILEWLSAKVEIVTQKMTIVITRVVAIISIIPLVIIRLWPSNPSKP
jgi:hypothetical protein